MEIVALVVVLTVLLAILAWPPGQQPDTAEPSGETAPSGESAPREVTHRGKGRAARHVPGRPGTTGSPVSANQAGTWPSTHPRTHRR